ncbi:MAG: alpha/beta hydrolase [Gemmatimonadetes bacterium]|nr:alpha/beta hydrolase [Gemmatimonadota bacterium]
MTETLRHRYADANGIRIHLAEEGRGPLVLLLHGFPEFWYGWRRQIPAIAEAGFRAVAPDLRGYNLSDKPRSLREYRMELLVDDVVGLVEALGEREAILVGHDWGGVIAWYAAMRYPEIVRRLVILNGPHPVAFSRELRRLSSQVWRSSYAGFFQLPWLPETFWRANGFAMLRRAIRNGPADSEQEADAYIEAFSHPGALTGALNYYRAAPRFPLPAVEIDSPTLLIWGERDPFLVSELASGLEPWVPGIRVQRLPDATHWLHHEQPQRVNELIVRFCRGDT